MSWMQRLLETYNNCESIAGIVPMSENESDRSAILLPIAHTLLKAHITVHLDISGDFLGAEAIEDRMGTIAPSTEDSESRSSTMAAPHPLFDKLQYLAGDYIKFTGQDNARYYKAYLEQLERWCHSPFSHPKIQAIFEYIKKGCLIHDLVQSKVIFLDSNGQVLEKWSGPKEDAPDLYKIANCTPSTVNVRFTVNQPGVSETRVWMDEEVRQNYIQYVFRMKEEKRLCYVSGQVVPFIEKHPKKIINILPNAKLISANDDTGFTYRGRFLDSSQAFSVGYETSLKAHNALRWLIETRGQRFDTKVILAFGTHNEPLPLPAGDSEEIFGTDETTSVSDLLLNADLQTQLDFSNRFREALLSHRYNHLDQHGDAVVLGLDSATEGRLSIVYYRELKSGEYLQYLANWHSTCIWLNIKNSPVDNSFRIFIGAPSFKDIGLAVYGSRGSSYLKKSVAERLLPCIFDNARIPVDLVNGAVRRAENPVSMERWEWNKTLSVACALYKKQHEKEGYHLALEENRTDRSYLFGRLLAVADQIERWALEGGDRDTNAMRYMNVMAKRPVETWRIISERLLPYQRHLKGKASRLNDLITNIMAKFEPGDFDKKPEQPLTGAYLLGFHCQRQVFLNERTEWRKQNEEARIHSNHEMEENFEGEEK